MRQKLLTTLALLLMAVSGAWADVTYSYEESTNKLTISGTGAMADYASASEQPWKDYRSSITIVVIDNGVTTIGNNAFSGCTNLEYVSTPSSLSLTSIGDYAFNDCTGLTYFSIPSSVTTIGNNAFSGSGLTSINIPSSVTSLGEGAFSGCTGLTSVDIQATTIGNNAFSGCTGLTSANIRATTIGEAAFSGCTGLMFVNIEAMNIGVGAFEGCELLSNVIIGDDVASIGDDAFSNCPNLANISVSQYNSTYDSRNSCNAIIDKDLNKLVVGCKGTTIPNTVTSLGNKAFKGCTGLTSITIPASVTSIGMNAFKSCTSLASVTSYAPSCALGTNAFSGCTSLANIYVFSDLEGAYQTNWSAYSGIITAIPNQSGTCGAAGNESDVTWQLVLTSTTRVLTISGTGAMVDYGNSDDQPWKDYRSLITSVVIEDGVTSIGNKAFADCTGLTSVTIPASVTSIGNNAFAECANLTSVTIPNGVTSIGNGAFAECANLISVTIPNSVTSIGIQAFYYCTGLASVTFAAGSTLASIGHSAFRKTGLTSITIPASVTTIDDDAFSDCTSLSSITLNEGLTTIGGYAFYNCGTTIESVTIPESVTSIGNRAFNGTNVTNFYINNIPSKIAIGETPFKADGVTIHVFTQMQSTFENATNWSAYTGHFSEDIAITHVQSVTLDNESMIVKTTASGKLNATINPADARVKDVVFTSSNDNIIYITNAATGEFITGATEGNATITCTAMDGSGQSASCTVTVQRMLIPAESVTLNKSSMSANVGNTLKLTATISPANATYKDVTWRSSDENVATVDNTGYVTAIAPGVATITAISHDGQARANCVVTVVASGSCGTGVTWTLTGTSPNYTLTISGTGAMANYNGQNMPWLDYKDDITTVVIEAGVTSIGNKAFDSFTKLESVTIPASVTQIGDAAFYGCTNLATVSGASGVTKARKSTIFYGTAWLNNLPDGLTYVGHVAYRFKGEGTSVELSDGTTQIADIAFQNSQITSISIPASVTFIGISAFRNSVLTSVTIPASVTYIDDYAFAYSALEKIYSLATSAPTLVNNAFQGCHDLTDVIVPATAYSNYNISWFGNSSQGKLKPGYTVTCDEGITTTAGPLVVEGETVTLAYSGTVPDGHTFVYTVKDADENDVTATVLSGTTLTMPGYNITVTGTTEIIHFEKDGITYEWTNNQNVKVTGYNGTLSSLVIPASVKHNGVSYNVTEIGQEAFMNSNLTELYLTNCIITVIEARAFKDCTNLSKIYDLSASLTTIEKEAFSGCNLTKITIPASVTSIGQRAFADCPSLTSVTLPETETIWGENPFEGCSENLIIYVPEHLVDTYRSLWPDANILAVGTIPYIAADGSTAYRKYGEYTELTGSTSTVTLGSDGETTWYVVNDIVNYGEKIKLVGDVNLILCDGKTMTAVCGSASAIVGISSNLTIYGQTAGTGELVAWSGEGSGIASNTLTINGGIVNANGTSYEGNKGISARGDVIINGGKVTAKGHPVGINAGGDIILGWTNSTDRIYASSFSADGTISIANGKAFTDDTNVYTSATSSDDLKAALNKSVTLIPKKDISTCSATVPNQTRQYNRMFYQFEAANQGNYSVGETIKDGETTLTLGQDYEFGSIEYADPNKTPSYAQYEGDYDQLGDELVVTINGKGDYSGTLYATFKIIVPDAEGTWNNLKWAYHDGTLTISKKDGEEGNVAMPDGNNYDDFDWKGVASSVFTLTIGEGITNVGNYAFGSNNGVQYYGNLTTINLPSTLTTIGNYAFAYCGGLTIDLSDIPTSVTTIGSNAFGYVDGLTATLTDIESGNALSRLSSVFAGYDVEVSFSRTFKENVASTLCLPFPMTSIESGTCYEFTSVNDAWTEVTMTSVNATSTTPLTAGKPYLFMPAADGPLDFTGIITNVANSYTAGTKIVGDWTFTGTYEEKRWDASNNPDGRIFGFATNQGYEGQGPSQNTKAGDFIRLNSGGIKPFRAYLEYTGSLQARTRGEGGLPETMTVRLVNANGEIQGIGEIRLSTGEVTFDSNAWYDLNGRRLEGKPSEKGIYINGGRKVVIK